MIKTLAVAVALAGAILLAPVAQAQPDSSTGPHHSNLVANGAAPSRGPTVTRAANKFVPTTGAARFGDIIARQPGLAEATTNGNLVATTGRPLGYATPMAHGNKVVPTITTTSLSGGIRTRHPHVR